MKGVLTAAFLIAAALYAPEVLGQSSQIQPHAGYVYPAGGRQGSTVEVVIGGQRLKGVTAAYVSGQGVTATSVRYVGPTGNLRGEAHREVAKRLVEALSKSGADLPPVLERLARAADRPPVESSATPAETEVTTVLTGTKGRPSANAILDGIGELSLHELELIAPDILKSGAKAQRNAQLGEVAFVTLQIAPDAQPGGRELRLMTQPGLTNPVRFCVGVLPETVAPVSYIPNQPPEAASATPPVVLNGQVRPEEVHHWQINAQKGQKLVFCAQARALMPFLADAVPGWFQAVLTLRDPSGKDVAYSDNYRFDQDPVLLYEVPETGSYDLEIRDAIYRGRQDFVYRVSVAEQPFVESVFPMGGQEGHGTVASIGGWNLDDDKLALDTSPDGPAVRETLLRERGMLSNDIVYAVDSLPEADDREPNNTARAAQKVNLPVIINGRISNAGDEDVFRFSADKGEEVVLDVSARKLGSPLDSIVRVTDSSGKVVATNDDFEDKEGTLSKDAGVLTHHADSYLCVKLPATGVYYAHIVDTQGHGGPEYGYRLRISRPRPNFELRVTPSTVNIMPGSLAPLYVYALRKDGFDGDIDVTLEGTPRALTLDGGMIPAGCSSIRMTLGVTRTASYTLLPLRLEGSAAIQGRTVTHSVVPCDDMMQAFLWRQLVPAQDLLATVLGRGAPPVLPKLVESGVRIAPGTDADAHIAIARRPMLKDAQFELSEAPEGISLAGAQATLDGVTLTVRADGAKARPGLRGNLIVEVFMERSFGQGKAGEQKRRTSLGVLPAIPFEVVDAGTAVPPIVTR